jgi:predicted permease
MIRIVFSKLVGMFWRRSLDEDFDAEMKVHLEMLTDENVHRGMPPNEARDAALRSMGNMTLHKEIQREGRGLPQIETLFADLKYGARMLRANPGFTSVAVLTLTLGIGVTTTVFTAYNAVALKPLPVSDANHVVRLKRWFENGNKGDVQYAFSYPEYKYCRDHNGVFSAVVVTGFLEPVVADGVEKLQGQVVSANYFRDLGVQAELGRTFLTEEDRTPGANPVMVISHAFWERKFHGEQSIVGRIVNLNGTDFTIVGVTPKEFTGTDIIPRIPDFWMPISMVKVFGPGYDSLNKAGVLRFQILARLKPATTISRAEAETAVLMRQFDDAFREGSRTTTVTLEHTAFLGNTDDVRFQASAWAIMLIVGMVLLVGCVNIANMLLARGAARQREISVRLALGAGRGRVIRQLLTESFLLSILGGVGGLLLSIWTSRLLWVAVQQFIQERIGSDIAIGIDISPDFRVVVYAMGLSLIAGLMFGLSPALQFSRPDLTTALKDEGSFGTRMGRSKLRGFLIATQVTVSMMLLITAGLLVRGLVRAQVASPGFETQTVFWFYGDYGGDPLKLAATERRLRDRLETLPELRNVSIGTMPLLGTWTPHITIGAQKDRTLASYASDTYFDLLGIPVLRGRHLTRLESDHGAPLAIVSEAAGRRFWPGEDPLGKHLQIDMDWRGSMKDFEVIGVAKDVRFTSLSRVDATHVYVGPRTDGVPNGGLLVRTRGDSGQAIAAVRKASGFVSANLPASLSAINLEAGPLQLQRSFSQVSAIFAAILAGLALALAGVGIFGVMSYLVSLRIKEIGVRVALGARAGDVLSSVVVRGLRPVFCGVILGIAGAAGVSAYIHSILVLPGSPDLLYGVPFYDPVTFIGLSLFLILIAAIASVIPARRALRVDPMVALRYE